MAPTTTTKTVEKQVCLFFAVTFETRELTMQEPPKPRTLDDMAACIDCGTFEQILEMDDEDERDFSKGIVFGFFDQAESTFRKMEEALKKKDLEELSSLGHFLKGSSATIGLTKVKDACEKIQHYGARKDESGANDEPDDEISLKKIEKTLAGARGDYKEVESFLREYFEKPATSS